MIKLGDNVVVLTKQHAFNLKSQNHLHASGIWGNRLCVRSLGLGHCSGAPMNFDKDPDKGLTGKIG